jgi:hypothetical protein
MTRGVAAQPALLASHRGKYGAAITAFPDRSVHASILEELLRRVRARIHTVCVQTTPGNSVNAIGEFCRQRRSLGGAAMASVLRWQESS